MCSNQIIPERVYCTPPFISSSACDFFRIAIARSGSQLSSSEMRKFSDNHMKNNGSILKNSGRKCISRAQMAEPYELSQDLLDRQVEALSNKYGGGILPHNAANTIQRAYRRYTMDKKFKAITSARNKTENRLSRRFANLACRNDSSKLNSNGLKETEAGHIEQHSVIQNLKNSDPVNSSYSLQVTANHPEFCIYKSSSKNSGNFLLGQKAQAISWIFKGSPHIDIL